MSDSPAIGIEQARADLGDLVLKTMRYINLSDAVTYVSRYGRNVAAIVPAEVAAAALDDDAEPHPVAIYRVALPMSAWRDSHRGVALKDLPERELGRVLGFAQALHSAMQRESGSDIYLAPHPVVPASDDLTWVGEMLDIADGIVADWTAWNQ